MPSRRSTKDERRHGRRRDFCKDYSERYLGVPTRPLACDSSGGYELVNFRDMEVAGLERRDGSGTSPGALRPAAHRWRRRPQTQPTSARPLDCALPPACPVQDPAQTGLKATMAAGLPAGGAADAPAMG